MEINDIFKQMLQSDCPGKYLGQKAKISRDQTGDNWELIVQLFPQIYEFLNTTIVNEKKRTLSKFLFPSPTHSIIFCTDIKCDEIKHLWTFASVSSHYAQ